MSRKRKRRQRTPSPAVTTRRSYLSAGLARDLAKGLVVIFVAVAGNEALGDTAVGKQLQLASYNLLQSRLSREDAAVTIVDIGELEPREVKVGGASVKATPRDQLRRMLGAIATHGPGAVGVDIDFAPDSIGLLPGDTAFFRYCLDLRRAGVPVFLGVARTVGVPSGAWLGDTAFRFLAANILVPRDTRRMVHSITVSGDTSRPLSVALAHALDARAGGEPGGLRSRLESLHLVERITHRELGPMVAAEQFWMDFGILDAVEPVQTTDSVVLASTVLRDRFAGKAVLLGDATIGRATDMFVVPGRSQPYPGVYLHAAAVQTLLAVPLFEVTKAGKFAIDVVPSVLILLVILFLRCYYSRSGETVATHRLQGIFTLLIVVIPIVAGVWFVRHTRILWHDFLLALFALVFHPSVERALDRFWGWIRSGLPSVWRKLALEQEEGRRHQ
jgi:CHASE2 domain-containing sensor protein